MGLKYEGFRGRWRVQVITIGRSSGGEWAPAVEAYRRRTRSPWAWDWVVVPAKKQGGPAARRQEATAALAHVRPTDLLIALDERGRQYTTRELHRWLARLVAGPRPLVLVLGGADGLGGAITARADATWSLSPLTWPHELAILMVAEQLYRVSTLDRGHPYHRD